MINYNPNPIDTSNVELSNDLLQLVDILARNVHENWSFERLRQGWQYGSERNDANKLHPCLVPFEELSEEEKRYDFITVMETIKVILGKGYDIRKIE